MGSVEQNGPWLAGAPLPVSSLSCAESAQLTAFSTSVPAAAPLSSGSTARIPYSPSTWHRSRVRSSTSQNVDVVQADGTQLPFRDGEFDVVFSNSVIEHVPKRLQHHFAKEVRRVGARYFVQTPYRYFPIEPHYQLPLFQFLPRRVQRALNDRFTLGWQEKGQWEEITLLSVSELRRLFPDAEIHRERVFGLTKSLMAVRPTVPEPS